MATSAPWLRRTLAASTRPISEAMCSAVRPARFLLLTHVSSHLEHSSVNTSQRTHTHATHADTIKQPCSKNSRRYVSCYWKNKHELYTSVYDDAPMPGRHCSTVSGGTLVTSLRDRITTASSFGCQPSTDSAATSADHIWRSGICCCWSVDVELTAKTSTWSLF